MKHFGLLCAAAVAAVCLWPVPPAQAQEELRGEKEKIPIVWKQLETKSYVIRYEDAIPESTVQKVAGELEDILLQYIAVFREKPDDRFEVKFLDSLNTYEQEGGDPSHPGHYNPRTKCLVIRQMPFYQLIPIVYHEAMHQYLAMWVGDIHIPTWFNEGMAMYYESMQRDDRGKKALNPENIDMGKLRMVKDAVRTRQHLALASLIDATYETFHDKDTESLHYNQSFAVIYFFVKAGGPGSVLSYMKELKKTGDAEQANEKLFGRERKNLEKIEKAWQQFMLSAEPERG